MQIEFYKDPRGNFGDDLNLWLWDALLPGWRGWAPDVTLLGVGTILNSNTLDPYRERRVLILGTGVGYGKGPPTPPFPAQWDIRAVRGPWSARALGLPEDLGVIDPAVMIADLPEFQGIRTAGAPVFVPHHRTVAAHDWMSACREAGLTYVSPEGDARDVVRRIAAAPLVLAEAMHAAIIADAFRVPWIPVRFGAQFNSLKWIDWAESMELRIDIPALLPRLDQVATTLAFRRGKRFQNRLRRILERRGLVAGLLENIERQANLSSLEVLERKKKQYRLILDATAATYGSMLK